jgi:hypothetical protein
MPVNNDSVSVGTAVTEIAGPSINSKLVYVMDGGSVRVTEVS